MILALGARGLQFDSQNAPPKEKKYNFERKKKQKHKIVINKNYKSTIKAFGISGMV